jgi:hypothetical protein
VTDPHVLGDGLLPTPFSAAEIRAGCPAGRTIRLLVEPASGASYERVNRFVACDDEGATIESWVVGLDGESVDRSSDRATWLDLQRHASFPDATTRRTEEMVDLPLGPVECVVYTTESGARFVFGKGHAGMPVRYELPDGEGGVEVTTMVADDH